MFMKISNTEHCFFCFNSHTNSFFKLKREENGGSEDEDGAAEGVDYGGEWRSKVRRKEKRRVSI